MPLGRQGHGSGSEEWVEHDAGPMRSTAVTARFQLPGDRQVPYQAVGAALPRLVAVGADPLRAAGQERSGDELFGEGGEVFFTCIS